MDKDTTKKSYATPMEGRRYGLLVVRERVENNERGDAMWLCDCDCGGTKVFRGIALRGMKYQSSSCGCVPPVRAKEIPARRGPREDLTGRRFGRLTVVSYGGRIYDRAHAWECICECGNTKKIAGSALRKKGGTKSCGCLSTDPRPYLGPKTPWHGRIINLMGQRFGLLTVVDYVGTIYGDGGGAFWKTNCDCGGTRDASGYRLRAGIVVNCGDKQKHPRGLGADLASTLLDTAPSRECVIGRSVGHKGYSHHLRVYGAAIGDPPEGSDLDHLCRVRRCVNPYHLLPVTREENQKRRLRAEEYIKQAGRNLTGEEWLEIFAPRPVVWTQEQYLALGQENRG